MAENLSAEGYVLHARSYRETSLLVEIVTLEHGREGVVARGARSRRGEAAARLQPFRRLHLGWRAQGDLGTLSGVEELDCHRLPPAVVGVGLYLNELLMRLLPRHQEVPDIYEAYAAALRSLTAELPVEPVLRSFELRLLAGLGYAPALDREADTGADLDPVRYYRLLPEHGPVAATPGATGSVSGAALLAMAREDWSEPETLAAAKRVLRSALEAQLGPRGLRTRSLLGGLARYRRMAENERPTDRSDD